MKKPIIAITADSLSHSPILGQNFAAFSPRDLKEVVIEAGGVPIILPFPEKGEKVEKLVEAHLDLFDGLVIPGGPDIDPIFYNEEPIPEIGATNYKRDRYEIALVKAAAKSGKAILGICRGLQLINVAFGGRLYQDLKTQNPSVKLKHNQESYGEFPTHHVILKPESQLEKLFGSWEPYVNSRHHQAVREVAPNLEAVAYSKDGIVEALESVKDNILAIQWHPEGLWSNDSKQFNIFKNLVERSKKE